MCVCMYAFQNYVITYLFYRKQVYRHARACLCERVYVYEHLRVRACLFMPAFFLLIRLTGSHLDQECLCRLRSSCVYACSDHSRYCVEVHATVLNDSLGANLIELFLMPGKNVPLGLTLIVFKGDGVLSAAGFGGSVGCVADC